MILWFLAGLWIAIGILTVVTVIVMSIDDFHQVETRDAKLFLLVPLGPILALLVLFWMIDERSSR